MARGPDVRCANGHEWTPGNTYVRPSGARECRACARENRANYKNPHRTDTPVTSWVTPAQILARRAEQAASQFPDRWLQDAACRGVETEVFFPERGDTMRHREAMSVCAGCPVRLDCLAANINEGPGVFGGTSAVERRRLRRRLFDLGMEAA